MRGKCRKYSIHCSQESVCVVNEAVVTREAVRHQQQKANSKSTPIKSARRPVALEQNFRTTHSLTHSQSERAKDFDLGCVIPPPGLLENSRNFLPYALLRLRWREILIRPPKLNFFVSAVLACALRASAALPLPSFLLQLFLGDVSYRYVYDRAPMAKMSFFAWQHTTLIY